MLILNSKIVTRNAIYSIIKFKILRLILKRTLMNQENIIVKDPIHEISYLMRTKEKIEKTSNDRKSIIESKYGFKLDGKCRNYRSMYSYGGHCFGIINTVIHFNSKREYHLRTDINDNISLFIDLKNIENNEINLPKAVILIGLKTFLERAYSLDNTIHEIFNNSKIKAFRMEYEKILRCNKPEEQDEKILIIVREILHFFSDKSEYLNKYPNLLDLTEEAYQLSQNTSLLDNFFTRKEFSKIFNNSSLKSSIKFYEDLKDIKKGRKERNQLLYEEIKETINKVDEIAQNILELINPSKFPCEDVFELNKQLRELEVNPKEKIYNFKEFNIILNNEIKNIYNSSLNAFKKEIEKKETVFKKETFKFIIKVTDNSIKHALYLKITFLHEYTVSTTKRNKEISVFNSNIKAEFFDSNKTSAILFKASIKEQMQIIKNISKKIKEKYYLEVEDKNILFNVFLYEFKIPDFINYVNKISKFNRNNFKSFGQTNQLYYYGKIFNTYPNDDNGEIYSKSSNFKYQGTIQNGQITGYGKLTENDGTICEGQFKKGKLHGRGKKTYSKEEQEKNKVIWLEDYFVNGKAQGRQHVKKMTNGVLIFSPNGFTSFK